MAVGASKQAGTLASPGRVAGAVLALSLGLAAVGASTTASAGAWVPSPGEGLAKLSLLGQRADERFGCNGAASALDADGSAYRERQLFAYAEHGIGRRWALVGSFAWKDARIAGGTSYGTRSTADLQLGGRFAVLAGATPVAVQGTLSVPTYPRSDLSAPVASRRQFLPAGSGRPEAELQLLVGRSLWPLPLYLSGGAGYRARPRGYSDVWLAHLELGAASASVFGKVELRAHLPTADPCGASVVGATAAAERSLALAPELAVRVAGAAWIAGGLAAPVDGVNALRAAQWSVGLMFWKRGG